MNELPTFSNYGQYVNDNYGTHAVVFSLGGIDVYFSYRTPVAFRAPGFGLVVRKNDWGATTGKHLNWIDDKRKADRIPSSEFEQRLAEAIKARESVSA